MSESKTKTLTFSTSYLTSLSIRISTVLEPPSCNDLFHVPCSSIPYLSNTWFIARAVIRSTNSTDFELISSIDEKGAYTSFCVVYKLVIWAMPRFLSVSRSFSFLVILSAAPGSAKFCKSWSITSLHKRLVVVNVGSDPVTYSIGVLKPFSCHKKSLCRADFSAG